MITVRLVCVELRCQSNLAKIKQTEMRKNMITKESLLNAGFVEVDDELCPFRKELISWEEVERHDLEYEEIPALIFGKNETNQMRFCIYTGLGSNVWINCKTAEEAVEFSNKILFFEPLV